MRFLGIGEWNDLGDMYLRLAAAGHEVRVHVADPHAHGILAGMITRCEDWRAELPWIRAAGDEGIVLCETASMGAIQDALRHDGYRVIGGCAFGDRLENERAFGQEVLRSVGLSTAPIHAFDDYDAAAAFVGVRPGRYVYKYNGSRFPSTHTYVGVLEDGSDLVAVLRAHARRWTWADRPSFVLMEQRSGVEVGVGAYFDGERFLTPACLDWEHKRFFPHDLGELTGEMGTLVTYRGWERIFAATLAPLAPRLRDGGYCGYINLNTIIDAHGIWPLEFTCRFGYPGFAILDALHAEGWDAILARLARRDGDSIATHAGWAVGVALTVPPFPYLDGGLPDGLPVVAHPSLDAEDRANLHYAEVAMRDGQLVVSGMLGYVLVATARGDSVEVARALANRRAAGVIVPNVRYRTDIGTRFLERDQALLRGWGWLDGVAGTHASR